MHQQPTTTGFDTEREQSSQRRDERVTRVATSPATLSFNQHHHGARSGGTSRYTPVEHDEEHDNTTSTHKVMHAAADGFNAMPAVLPSGLERFVDEVVPILQDRGLFRTEYTGSTLREHYGLPRPANRLFDTVDSSAGHPGITLTEVR